jgi:hypothetical protein
VGCGGVRDLTWSRWTHLASLGRVLALPGKTWAHLGSLACAWFHFDSLGLIGIDLDSLRITCSNVV